MIGLGKKFVKKILKGQFNSGTFLLIAEIENYFNQIKHNPHFYCNLCKEESPYFYHTSNEKRILKNSICPNCSSRKRHRGLFELYKDILSKLDAPKILHFAPEPVFYDLFKPYQYYTADLELTDVDIQLDIENINYSSDSFDLILCNHVLEHVSNDNMALCELQRILKPSGIAIITVPGNWNREETIEYNQPDSNGHQREYGLIFLSVLNDIFSGIQSIDLFKYNQSYHMSLGLTPQHDLALLCHKS